MFCYSVTVVPGYQVASGLAVDAEFEQGSIALQKPHFKQRGIDLTHCFNGTINVAFNVQQVAILRSHHHIEQLKWYQHWPAEDFDFVKCELCFNLQRVTGFIYQPSPTTKIDHYQPANVLELLAPKLDGLVYGSKLELLVEHGYLMLHPNQL